MPPRLRTCNFSPSSSQTCVLARQQGQQLLPRQCQPGVREFSHSCPHARYRPTRLRRELYGWLNGPGVQYRQHIPGQTNYLGHNAGKDSDENAELARSAEAEETDNLDDVDNEASGADDEALIDLETGLPIANADGAHGSSAAESKELDDEAKRKAAQNARGSRPFPLNRYFQVDPVLSDELREEIYQQLIQRNMPLFAISSRFGVTMERCAAVARLKQVEKDWVAQVCLLFYFFNGVFFFLLHTPFFLIDGPSWEEFRWECVLAFLVCFD